MGVLFFENDAYAISEVEEADWWPISELLYCPLIQRHVLFGGLDRKAGMQRRRRPDDELAAEFSSGYRGRRLMVIGLTFGDVLVDSLLYVGHRLLHRGRPLRQPWHFDASAYVFALFRRPFRAIGVAIHAVVISHAPSNRKVTAWSACGDS
jgi:hypothetical protein